MWCPMIKAHNLSHNLAIRPHTNNTSPNADPLYEVRSLPWFEYMWVSGLVLLRWRSTAVVSTVRLGPSKMLCLAAGTDRDFQWYISVVREQSVSYESFRATFEKMVKTQQCCFVPQVPGMHETTGQLCNTAVRVFRNLV